MKVKRDRNMKKYIVHNFKVCIKKYISFEHIWSASYSYYSWSQGCELYT